MIIVKFELEFFSLLSWFRKNVFTLIQRDFMTVFKMFTTICLSWTLNFNKIV